MSSPRSVWTSAEPRLHLRIWRGKGVPLLLVHGMAGNAHWWDTTAPLLSGGFMPAALDLHGHGDSAWRPDGRYDTDVWVENIDEARRELSWADMVLCGHSLGARLSLEYARRHPGRVRALIAVDFLPEVHPAGSRKFERARGRPQPYYASAEEMENRFRLQPPGTLLGISELKALGRLSLREDEKGFTWKYDWRAFSYRYPPIWPTLHEVKTRTLLVRGENSLVIGKDDFARAAAALPGAKAVEIPKAHHHVPLDAPEELARAIRDFAACPASAA